MRVRSIAAGTAASGQPQPGQTCSTKLRSASWLSVNRTYSRRAASLPSRAGGMSSARIALVPQILVRCFSEKYDQVLSTGTVSLGERVSARTTVRLTARTAPRAIVAASTSFLNRTAYLAAEAFLTRATASIPPASRTSAAIPTIQSPEPICALNISLPATSGSVMLPVTLINS